MSRSEQIVSENDPTLKPEEVRLIADTLVNDTGSDDVELQEYFTTCGMSDDQAMMAVSLRSQLTGGKADLNL